MLTAEVDDTEESDALNDETFGEGNLRMQTFFYQNKNPKLERRNIFLIISTAENDEWEIEYLSEQTESAENSIKSQGDVYGVNDSVDSLEVNKILSIKQNLSNNLIKILLKSQEMVEKSIFNLMADDDFPTGRPIPKVHTVGLLNLYFFSYMKNFIKKSNLFTE